MSRRESHENWSEFYSRFISRNIGIISVNEQEKIRNSKIAIFGVGGLGAPLAEQLVRAGCEHITIIDNGKFETSNLNRQYCTINDMGKLKVDVINDLLKLINPQVEIIKIYSAEDTLKEIVQNIDIAILTLDDLPLSISIARICRDYNIPLLESWGIPYIWCWWFNSDNISYEKCYNFPTEHLTITEMKKDRELLTNLKLKLYEKLLQFPNIKERYDREPGTVNGLIQGKLPLISFAPIVRMTASYLAFEVIFTGILKIKKMILAPKIMGYDFFEMEPISF
ncbi:MAG: ThiF family adenylyltransferase [Candidatus Hermodarchaeota archaeon]